MVALLAIPAYAADLPAPIASETSTGLVAQVPSAPAPIALSRNAAEVVKLSGAGLGDEVILAYIKTCPSPFKLAANEILHLKETGVSSPVIAAMLTHDNALRGQNPPAPNAANPQPPAGPSPAQAPPAPPSPAPVVGTAPADQTPPPPPVEVITVAPGPDYYWTPGYWGWNGGWIWIGGGWGLRGGYYGWGWYGHGGWGGYHGGYYGGHYGGGHGGGGHHR